MGQVAHREDATHPITHAITAARCATDRASCGLRRVPIVPCEPKAAPAALLEDCDLRRSRVADRGDPSRVRRARRAGTGSRADRSRVVLWTMAALALEQVRASDDSPDGPRL